MDTNTDTDTAKTVLVIDDNDMFREVVCDVLEMNDIDVLSAATGQAGIDLFTDQHTVIQAILLDAVLPDHELAYIIEKIRAQSTDVSLIISSGFPWTQIVNDHGIKESDVNGHLSKPFDVAELTNLMDEIL